MSRAIRKGNWLSGRTDKDNGEWCIGDRAGGVRLNGGQSSAAVAGVSRNIIDRLDTTRDICLKICTIAINLRVQKVAD